MNAGHQTRTTNQFQIKKIYAHIEIEFKISKIKEAKEEFDKDIETLKGNEFSNLEKLENKKFKNSQVIL